MPGCMCFSVLLAQIIAEVAGGLEEGPLMAPCQGPLFPEPLVPLCPWASVVELLFSLARN